MTPRVLLRVWIASFVLVVVAVGATVAFGWNKASIVFSLGDARVAVVGSSLLRNGVPFESPDGGILGDGRPHARIGVSGLTEAEAIKALNDVVEQRADIVLLEANVFVIDIGQRGGRSRTWSPRSWWSKNVGVPFRRGIDRLQGRAFTVNLASENLLSATFKPKPATLKRLYPVAVHQPRDPIGFGQVVTKAEEGGVRVVLVVPPRPSSVAEAMGPENLAEVQAAYDQMATKYGLQLWVIGPTWPDELFGDHAHLNRAGRERFVTELREKYRGPS